MEIQHARNNDLFFKKWNDTLEGVGQLKRKDESRDLLSGIYCLLSSKIYIVDGFLLRNYRLVIPAVLQKQILNQIHIDHQGISKCRYKARQSVWKLGWSTELESMYQ